MRYPLIGIALVMLTLSTQADVLTPRESVRTHRTFDRYWYQGLAEIDRYRLVQSRYGEAHDGEAVLIFVTEDFLPGPQVKHEFGEHDDVVPILKLNAYRRFYTGIYPYTMMTSVFSPVDGSPTLKRSSTVQEWCGNAFTQLNREPDGYRVELRSYFQGEGDQTTSLGDALLEEELFVQIRLDPATLPTGPISLIPAAHHLRMAHLEAAVATADASLRWLAEAPAGDGPVGEYSIVYRELARSVTITFERAFPHRIVAWEEGASDGSATTRAELTHAILLDYWNHNGADDGAWREALGLAY
jgi:hypothetical protein